MANIPAALVVLEAHLAAAAAAVVSGEFDVDRGLPTGGKQLRYYWGGEVDPPHMPTNRDLTGEVTGERIIIAALWPLADLSIDTVTLIDIEMQSLAGQVRTKIDADSKLGGNVVDLELGNADPDIVLISNARHVALTWTLDLSFVEYTLSASATLAPYVVPLTSTPEDIVDSLQTVGLILEVQAVTATAEMIVYALQSHGLLLLLDPLTATPEDICDALILAAIMAPS